MIKMTDTSFKSLEEFLLYVASGKIVIYNEATFNDDNEFFMIKNRFKKVSDKSFDGGLIVFDHTKWRKKPEPIVEKKYYQIMYKLAENEKNIRCVKTPFITTDLYESIDGFLNDLAFQNREKHDYEFIKLIPINDEIKDLK